MKVNMKEMTMRDLSNTNPQQAAATGWVVDKGDPGMWETICKAHFQDKIMKSTKRMQVPGGWLYCVTTEHPNGVAEALAFVPDGNCPR